MRQTGGSSSLPVGVDRCIYETREVKNCESKGLKESKGKWKPHLRPACPGGEDLCKDTLRCPNNQRLRSQSI